jgi:glycosyltransferase involved in cell wall biosynthesis
MINTDAPLVSVIIPVFNGEQFLAEAIESACGQTYTSVEIIVVDDGSWDRSSAIADAYAKSDARLAVLRKPNGGLSSARNAGISFASGKYIAFLDADDLWDERKIQMHVLHLEGDAKLGVSYSGVRFMNADGSKLRHRRIPKSQNLSNYYLYCRNPITNGSNGIFRREVFEDCRFDESLLRNQDVDCWLRIAFNGRGWKFGGIRELLTFYRVVPTALSTDFEVHFRSAKEVWKKSFEYAPRIAARFASLAEAFQLRFYARRAISSGDRVTACHYLARAIRLNYKILIYEPISSLQTLIALLMPNKLILKINK